MPDASAQTTPATPAGHAPPTLYIIDGYAQFFRAFHAIRTPMSSPVTKEPTNMSFGFLGMLLKLLRGGLAGSLNSPGSAAALLSKISENGGRADYVVVALDVSDDRGTFRSELYPDYKAHRPLPPEDLGPQVDRCLDTLRRIGVPILGSAGFEADDVIATLITRLRAQHPELRVRIISKDKDLKQLLGETPGGAPVELYDIHSEAIIDAAALKADCGLSPAQIIDYLALMGDNVDNVPGVEGVGPKTAAQLICEYGSLDAVIEEAQKPKSKITGKRLENIRAAASQLPLSKQLVTLRHDVPVELDLNAAKVESLKLGELMPVLKELGFNRYQDELRALMGVAGTIGAASGTPSAATSAQAREDDLHQHGASLQFMRPGFAGASGGSITETKPTGKSGTSKSPALEGGLFTGGLFDQPAATTSSAPRSIVAQAGEYRLIADEKSLREHIEQCRGAECVSIDTETTGIPALRHQLAGICLSIRSGTGVYIPVRSPNPKDHLSEQRVLDLLRPVLQDPTINKCGHNLKFDMLVFRKAGVRLAGFFTSVGMSRSGSTPGESDNPHFSSLCFGPSTVFDSMVASYLIDAERSSHGLDSLALALLGRTNISITELIGTGKDQITFDKVPLEAATQYAAEDADVALQLREKMLPQLHAMQLWDLFSRVEMPLVEVLAELEWNGIRVDRAELDHQRQRLQKRIDELRMQIVSYTEDKLLRPFNPDSPKQLAAVLFNKSDATDAQGGPGFGIKPIKKNKTGYSTDAEVLQTLAEDASIDNPIPKLIVEHRELTKLVNTYLASLVEEIYSERDETIPPELRGRIHSSFNQTVAATGRLASSDPNLQNIPIRTDVGREIRKAFVATPGNVLLSADYSQIELRLLAHLSRDPALIQAFLDGQDIHTAVAAQIHNVPLDQVTRVQRSGAKMVNFGIVYGVTAFGLARRLGVSNTEAEEIITGYKKRFAGITTFLQECIDQATRFGYVQTMLGRRRPIPDIESTNPSRRSFGERTAINSVVQGSAADLIKLAMVELHARCWEHGTEQHTRTTPLSLRMLLQIHDELVFECSREEAEASMALVTDCMEKAMTLAVPLKADARFATNWFEGK
jgi:DNA polymerase-1